MNALEQQLHYEFGDQLPTPGGTLEVAHGVRWIRMALPFALDHINLWLLRDHLDGRDGWTVIDCCISHGAAKAQWETLFADALEGLPILRVLVTHMHPDHVGLAHWLCERWNAPLWMSATDYYTARLAIIDAASPDARNDVKFFASHGMTDPQVLDEISRRFGYYKQLVPALPNHFRRLLDGDVVRIGHRQWRCISGYGHAPEHIALHSPEDHLLIGGDMMLPRISTNVSVSSVEPDSNALASFLASIDKFLPMEADTMTLPSHGKPFKGLHERIAQLHAHHQERLQELLDACQQQPRSAHDILPLLFKRPLDVHQSTFAMGETVAHLNHLWLGGHVNRNRDERGIYRYAGLEQLPG